LGKGEKVDGRDVFAEEMRRVIRATWQNASAPARVLNRLTEVLGPQLNRWDYAGELCDRLLQIDPARPELWLRRIEIALQRPGKDDVLGILSRLRAAGGPRRQAMQRVRSVYLETGDIEKIAASREALGLPVAPRTASEAWQRFEEALSALAFTEARSMLDLYLSWSGTSLEAHRRAVDVLRNVGWRTEALHRIQAGMRLYPGDIRMRWYSYELELTQPQSREAAMENVLNLIEEAGVAPGGTEDAPDAEMLIRLLSGQELLQVAEAAEQRIRRWSDIRVIRAVGYARTGQKRALRKEIEIIDTEGLDVPESLLVIVREVAKEGMEDVAVEVFAKVRRWSGFLLGSRHLMRVLDDLVSTRKVSGAKLKAVGRLGVAVTQEYLRVSIPGVASTTSMATFSNAAGDPDAAVVAYAVLTERIPGEASTLNNLAYHNAVTGTQLPEGLAMVNAALRMEPSGAPFYLDTRGWIFYRMGEFEKAERDVVASLRLTPLVRGISSAEAHAHAAEIALERGDVDKACRHALRVKILKAQGHIAERASAILGGIFENPVE